MNKAEKMNQNEEKFREILAILVGEDHGIPVVFSSGYKWHGRAAATYLPASNRIIVPDHVLTLEPSSSHVMETMQMVISHIEKAPESQAAYKKGTIATAKALIAEGVEKMTKAGLSEVEIDTILYGFSPLSPLLLR